MIFYAGRCNAPEMTCLEYHLPNCCVRACLKKRDLFFIYFIENRSHFSSGFCRHSSWATDIPKQVISGALHRPACNTNCPTVSPLYFLHALPLNKLCAHLHLDLNPVIVFQNIPQTPYNRSSHLLLRHPECSQRRIRN